MFLINLMLFLKLQQGFDEDLVIKIIMKLIFTWFIFFVFFSLLCYKKIIIALK